MEIGTNNENRVLKFLFPFYPIKAWSSTHLLILMAALIALRIIFGLFSIPLPGLINVSLSFAWVPVMLMGWFFGPLIGLILGFTSDTIAFFIANTGSVWYWLYAIQEPLVGFCAGLAGGVCTLRKTAKSFKLDLIIQQIVYFSFAIICYLVLIVWATPDSQLAEDGKIDSLFFSVYKWIGLGLLTIFLVVIEWVTFSTVRKHKNNLKYMLTHIYTSILVVIIMMVFSFLLGPISAISYFQFLNNGHDPSNYLKYGTLYYLIPRVAVESVKTPLECMLLTTLVISLTPAYQSILNTSKLKWF